MFEDRIPVMNIYLINSCGKEWENKSLTNLSATLHGFISTFSMYD